MPDDDFATKLASIIPAGRSVIASDIRIRISEDLQRLKLPESAACRGSRLPI